MEGSIPLFDSPNLLVVRPIKQNTPPQHGSVRYPAQGGTKWSEPIAMRILESLACQYAGVKAPYPNLVHRQIFVRTAEVLIQESLRSIAFVLMFPL